MPNSLRMWTPRGPALAVYVRGHETLDWEQYLGRLGKVLTDLAKGQDDAEWILEEELDVHLSDKGMVSAPDNLQFQEILTDRHNLSVLDFPMEVGSLIPKDEPLPTNLEEWIPLFRAL